MAISSARSSTKASWINFLFETSRTHKPRADAPSSGLRRVRVAQASQDGRSHSIASTAVTEFPITHSREASAIQTFKSFTISAHTGIIAHPTTLGNNKKAL